MLSKSNAEEEMILLLPSQHQRSDDEKNSPFSRSRYASMVMFPVVGLIVLLGFIAWSNEGRIIPAAVHRSTAFTEKTFTSQGSDESSVKRDEITITITNEYSALGMTMFDYPFLRDAWLMEPYRESIVSVSGLSKQCGLSWKLLHKYEEKQLRGGEKMSWKTYSSAVHSFVVETGGPGQYLLVVNQECTRGVHKFPILVKYVRRELMSLTDRDREEFLDALKVLWDVNTVEGREMYGPKYKSVHYFASIHNDAGSNVACDEFHVGPAFLINHALLGSYFEQSLQLVNPRTCLHYMEYTRYYENASYNVGHAMNSNDGGTWTVLMTSKWFGSNDPKTGHILDGRWKELPVPFMDDQFFESHGINKYQIFFPAEAHLWKRGMGQAHYFNPYGLLRSPWDFSPEPYLLRFNNYDRLNGTQFLPLGSVHCTDYKNYIQSFVLGQSFEYAMMNMEGQAHNGVHFGIAGAGGELNSENDELLVEDYGFTATDLQATSHELYEFRKTQFTLWMKGAETMITCTDMPFDYDTGILTSKAPPGTKGGMTCDFVEKWYESEETVDKFLTYLYTSESYSEGLLNRISFMDAKKKKSLLRLLGSRYQYFGDLGSSSAALDPIFWVIHGSPERLFQRIVFENVLTDMSYTYGSDAFACSGHAYDGKKAWLEGFFFEDRSIDATDITNQEFVKIFNPRSESYAKYFSFIYESKDWNWCSDFDSYFSK